MEAVPRNNNGPLWAHFVPYGLEGVRLDTVEAQLVLW